MSGNSPTVSAAAGGPSSLAAAAAAGPAKTGPGAVEPDAVEPDAVKPDAVDPAAVEPGAVEWEPSAERRQLGNALRRLLDVVVQTGAGPAELGAATAVIDELTASLGESVIRPDFSIEPNSYRANMSLVGGLSHPIAPQLTMDVHEHGGSGEVVLGKVFQGGPGLVHGGIVALLIDHAMGCVAVRPERPAMTVRLALRYRRPTPLGVPLAVSVSLDRIEGRQLYLSATVSARGEVTVEAEGTFLTLTTQNLGSVFGRR